LWIHAGNQRPTEEAIRDAENYYEQLYASAGDRPLFPQQYPTGALLGRIEVIDCLTQDEYRRSTPETEIEYNDSRFHFIVQNPSKLIVPIKMHGGKQIYNMEHEIWEGARKGLRRVWTGWWPVAADVEDSELFS
jgi:hypothetical protein